MKSPLKNVSVHEDCAQFITRRRYKTFKRHCKWRMAIKRIVILPDGIITYILRDYY